MTENYKSHYCCFEQGENPACNLPLKHTQCCLCDKPWPTPQQEIREKKIRSLLHEYTENIIAREHIGNEDDYAESTLSAARIADRIVAEIEAAEELGWAKGANESYETGAEAHKIGFLAGQKAMVEKMREKIKELKGKKHPNELFFFSECINCGQEVNKDFVSKVITEVWDASLQTLEDTLK
jgi:hypothetical protein